MVGDRLDRSLEQRRLRRDARHDRVHQHAGVDAGVDELAHRAQPLQRMRGARFELRATRPRRRDGTLMQTLQSVRARQILQHVLVADDHRSLGDDADRVAVLAQRFERSARQLVVALDRLIAVGGGAERDVARASTTACPARARSTSTKFVFTKMTDANSSSAPSSNCVW